MTISQLFNDYKNGITTPRDVMAQIRARIEAHAENPIFIHALSEAETEPYLERLEGVSPASLPLYGIPFAIKDNIDLAGIPTTAACPAYSYVPEASAFVVERLIEAGAIPVGKTNLDQFATGLVGTRSPYGACRNSIDPAYISGGSSSGSAISVALEMAAFSLGTDTAGSGRVPAAFNNLVGVKPSKGVLSTSGVVPACRSLDCVSIFALNTDDAKVVFDIACAFDAEDPYSRKMPATADAAEKTMRFAVPLPSQLKFFGDTEAEALFNAAVTRFESMGYTAIETDFSPMLDAANLLYSGPWVAERYIAAKQIMDEQPEEVLDVTRSIIEQGRDKSAVEYFAAEYRLKEYKRQSELALEGADFALTPTTGTIYTVEALNADPVQLNTNLGYYTNFMNLLDFAAYAVPAGFRPNGLPFGVTLFGDAFEDRRLMEIGKAYVEVSRG
ncbi:allophanate hydrolase [Sulfurimonas sp. HSL-1656]|uniref:allophanate hydrolase n=1 Tax=Thiomicrolovo subterrani TaxID=3131934 RepID=UPI0031F8D4FC